MSLETLLEAARYIEYESQAIARGDEPYDYCTFAKLSASKDGLYNYSPKRQQTLSHSSHSSTDEVKEKRRSITLISRDLSHEHTGTGTREVHNKLEKNRRAHLKECFEGLKKQLLNMDDRKTSNLSILRGAIRCIQTLKRKERENEHEMERLAREKIALQQRLSGLRKDLSSQLDNHIVSYGAEEENETTTTASECGHLSDFDDSPQNESPPANTNSDFTIPSTTSASSSVPMDPHSSAPLQSPIAVLRQGVSPNGQPPNKESIGPFLVGDPGAHQAETPQTARVLATSNLHTIPGIFATSHSMQVITQQPGIKVITTPSSIVAPSSSVQHISMNPHPQGGQIHVLAPSSSTLSYPTKSFSADSLVHVPSAKKQHLVSPLALVHSPSAVVSMGHVNSAKQTSTKLIEGTLNLSQKGLKSSPSPQQNMVLHVSKPHAHVIQSSNIITQGSQVNNGTHHGITTGLKPLVSTPVRTLPHITGIAHVVSQSPVSQIVAPGNHPLVSMVSHAGHPKMLATSPILKSSIPLLQQQFLHQVSASQPVVKPVVVVSVPSVVTGAEHSGMVRK